MAISRGADELAQALGNRIGPSRREVAWLWVFLSRNGVQLDPNLYGTPAGKAEMVHFLKTNPYRINEVNQRMKSDLLPDPTLSWITQESRQMQWLAAELGRRQLYAASLPPLMSGRDRLIALIDTWDASVTEKQQTLRFIEGAWHALRRQDKLFSWFDEKDRTARCSAAWEWLCANEPYQTTGKAPFGGYADLISFFDQSNWDEATKDLYVIKIKRRWSQKAYRERLQDKKQYNFVLSDATNQQLNQLAAKHNLKRNRILEILIETEATRNLYISAQLGSRPSQL